MAPPPEIAATLLKLRNRSDPGSDKKIAAAYAYLGIKQEPMVVLVPLKDVYLHHVFDDKAAAQQWAAQVKVGAPAKPVAGVYYSTAVPTLTFADWLGGPRYHADLLPGSMYGAPGYRLSVPGAPVVYRAAGASFGQNGRIGFRSYYDSLDREASERATCRVVELASEALGMLTPEAARGQKAAEKKAAKVAKGAGHCGVCFGVHAIHTGGRVHTHGYKMRGHSRGQMWKAGGDCFGARYLCWEKSPEATTAASESMKHQAQHLRQQAAAWGSGGFPDIYYAKNRYGSLREVAGPHADLDTQRGEKLVVLRAGDTGWDAAVAAKVKHFRAEAAEADANALWYAKTAAGWPKLPSE